MKGEVDIKKSLESEDASGQLVDVTKDANQTNKNGYQRMFKSCIDKIIDKCCSPHATAKICNQN